MRLNFMFIIHRICFVMDVNILLPDQLINNKNTSQMMKQKKILLYSIRKGISDKGWILEDWVILDNHYHLMADSGENGEMLKSIINSIHRYTATWLNKHDNYPGRKVWYNYWDTVITYERSYYTRLNYLWYNPVKHGYCQYAEDYIYCSFRERYLEDKADMEDIRDEYPWDEVKVYDV